MSVRSVPRTCERCGSPFLTSRLDIERGWGRFCSRACSNRARAVDPSLRFWDKVNKNGPTPEHRPELGPCWEFTGARTAWGYGNFKTGDGFISAHRFAYQLLVGPIPSHLELDHLCRFRACCNPSHLEPVTPLENSIRSSHALMRVYVTGICIHGHTLDDSNTWMDKTGHRHCRACRQDANRRHWQKVKADRPAPKPPGLSGKWARHFDRCVRCGESSVPHKGHGLCDRCHCRSRRVTA
jgi:hypothetical protein